MKSVKLYYNPTAGEGEHSKATLTAHIGAAGYEIVSPVRSKKGISNLETEVDILAVAGGDGTVRSACLDLLDMPLKYSRPIGLLAKGTANNIALTLNIDPDVKKVIRSWAKHQLKRFDVGRINGLKTASFFVESFGFGVFPKLMKKMSKLPPDAGNTPAREMEIALEQLLKIVQDYKPVPCSVIIDGREYDGEYLLAELMNIRSLGPKLVLAPGADPGDGHFDVLLLGEQDREPLAVYIEKIKQGKNPRLPFSTIRGRDIAIHWGGKHLHIDDELIRKYKPGMLHVKLLDGMLDFLIGKE